MTDGLSALRRIYDSAALDESTAPELPFTLFRVWLAAARDAGLIEANAMVLSTVAGDGTPSSRTVLLKGADESGLVFYSNYESRKGHDIDRNPTVALLFYWAALERQVRVTGTAARTDAAESDRYFDSRPEGSRIGAAISPQSEVVPDRAWLERRKADAGARLAADGRIARPQTWGGYRVSPVEYEFWQGRPDRLHDRLRYRVVNGVWLRERLAP